MAMILDAFAGKMIERLAEFVEERVVTVLGAKDEVKRLQRRMTRIKHVLRDAERKRIQSEAIANWVRELKDVVYDADDIIDLCRFEGGKLLDDQPSASTASRSVRCNFPSSLSCFSSFRFRHDIGYKIKNLNQRLDDITKDMSGLELVKNEPDIPVPMVNPRQTSSLVDQSDIVGEVIEHATEDLVERIVRKEGEQKCRIFAITGMGGIGKTTLAKNIFNHQKIQSEFSTKIWVCISQNFSETDLLKEIIRGAGGNHGDLQTRSELERLLQDIISKKRFFLVLDDVWRADVWVKMLRHPLQCGAIGSRILVTTTVFGETLVVVEGFVETQKDSFLELADEYFEDLVRRNLVQKEYTDDDRFYKMHDLLRSLAQFLSRDESFCGEADELTTVSTTTKLRRLTITDKGELEVIPEPLLQHKSLRTLFLRSCPRLGNDLFVRFPFLRFLMLSDSAIENIPDAVGNLVHLRLLDLDNTKISNLPESVRNLTNLEVLSLSGCESLRTLPNGITRLCNLWFLDFYDTPLCFIPAGMGRLEKLNILEGFVVGEDSSGSGLHQTQGCRLEDLKSLSQLRELSIDNLERAFVAQKGQLVLRNKPYLRDLTLSCSGSTLEHTNEIEEVFAELFYFHRHV